MADDSYHIPLALTIISGIFLCIGGILGLLVLMDILSRRGWRNMMAIMIVVYPINALYNFPTVWLYWKYGGPTRPRNDDADSGDKLNNDSTDEETGRQEKRQSEAKEQEPHLKSESRDGGSHQQLRQQHNTSHCHQSANLTAAGSTAESLVHGNANQTLTSASDGGLGETGHAHGTCHGKTDTTEPGSPSDEPHCHAHAAKRPMWATVLVGVAHCGAGCVLGDIVGEWLVYGTGAKINGAMIWPELLIDYAFALLFGIVFQYFSIAPMTGEWGVKTVWRAAKADILSLTSFEVGAFAWMIIFQVAIFNYKLDMASWTYWWLMQMGMNFGYATAVPMNYWLLRAGIKEPCC